RLGGAQAGQRIGLKVHRRQYPPRQAGFLAQGQHRDRAQADDRLRDRAHERASKPAASFRAHDQYVGAAVLGGPQDLPDDVALGCAAVPARADDPKDADKKPAGQPSQSGSGVVDLVSSVGKVPGLISEGIERGSKWLAEHQPPPEDKTAPTPKKTAAQRLLE